MNRKAWRLLLLVPILGGAITLIVLRGPNWHTVSDAFSAVSWAWVAAAIGLNLLSVVTRAFAWETTIKQALAPPCPRFPLVFSAFSVGLFANAVLPGRVGELARVAVLRRRLPGRKGATATLIGSVFAHRMFDLFPAATLVVWVLFTAKLPNWAFTSIAVVLIGAFALFLAAVGLARRQNRDTLDSLGTLRHLLARARLGITIMRRPAAAAAAATFQYSGWFCQLLAVWAAMKAFQINESLAAAGLVLVLINVATIVPLWPGNVGLTQIAVATPLVSYGVDYAHGFAFGLGLQAIEASVGVGVGLIFLTREGLSYAMLKQMEGATEEAAEETPPGRPASEHARARVPG